MAVLGRGDAIAEVPLPLGYGTSSRYRLRFARLAACLLWVGMHIAYPMCVSSRIKVLVDWGWSYLTSRGAVAILVRPLGAAPKQADISVNGTGPSRGQAQPAGLDVG